MDVDHRPAETAPSGDLSVGRSRPPARACIIGIGVVTPIGSDAESFWRSLLEGRSGAAPVLSFDTSHLSHHVGCEVGALALPDRLRRRDRGDPGCCPALFSFHTQPLPVP